MKGLGIVGIILIGIPVGLVLLTVIFLLGLLVWFLLTVAFHSAQDGGFGLAAVSLLGAMAVVGVVCVGVAEIVSEIRS